MPIDCPPPPIEHHYKLSAKELAVKHWWHHHHYHHREYVRNVKPTKFKRTKPIDFEYQRIRYEIFSVNKLCRKKKEDGLHEIVPGLYIGSQKDADKHPQWITRVLTCRQDPLPPKNKGCEWKGINVRDKENVNIKKHFQETYDFIEGTKGAILVHCKMGGSRSPTIVIAYIMKKYDVPYEAAFKYVRDRNPRTGPNPGFRRQLQKYEKMLQKKRPN